MTRNSSNTEKLLPAIPLDLTGNVSFQYFMSINLISSAGETSTSQIGSWYLHVFYVNIHLFTWFGPCIDFYLNCMKWSWFIYHSAFKRGLIHSCTIFPLNSTLKIGIVVLHGMDTNFGKFSGVYGLILHTTVINFFIVSTQNKNNFNTNTSG